MLVRPSGAVMGELSDANLSPAEGDCISHIPAEVKDAAAAAHGNREPADTPVRPAELV
jgi:hypothetical protein